MTFLLGQIATCLLLAFLAGFLLGWLVREISRRDRDDVVMSARYADGYGELVTETNAARYRRSSNIQTVLGEVE